MRVFVTGSTGFIGSAVVAELLGAGHQVLGLARGERGIAALRTQGAEPLAGSLDDLDVLRAGAARADAVVTLAFDHSAFATGKFVEAATQEARALEAIIGALEGSGRLLAIASGTLFLNLGGVATEDTPANGAMSPRQAGHALAAQYMERGGKTAYLRFAPTVHGAGDKGFMAMFVNAARATGVAGYVGDGSNRWPAVHRLDAARMIRLAIEQSATGPLHATGEDGVRIGDVAKLVGEKLGLPLKSIAQADAQAHFGPIGMAIGLDAPASSAKTRARLGWEPTQPGLLADMAAHYF